MATNKPRVVVYLDNDLKVALEELAIKRNRSISNLLQTLAKEEIRQAQASGELTEIAQK